MVSDTQVALQNRKLYLNVIPINFWEVVLKFAYLRIFALEVELPPILLASGDIDKPQSRTDYLIEIFSQRIEFLHRSKLCIYVPISTDTVEGGAVCTGRIGTEKTENINASPEKLFEPEVAQNWHASDILIDTRDYNDGQKIALQFNPDVGGPLSIAKSLIRHINERNPDSGWELAVNPITEKSTFWSAVKEFDGQITRAEFRYETPNVLGLKSKINKRLKEYKDEENANQVLVALENKNGNLKLDSQEVKDAVEYTSEGGGSTKLKAGSETVYNSEDDERVVTAETDDSEDLDDANSRKSIIDRLFRR